MDWEKKGRVGGGRRGGAAADADPRGFRHQGFQPAENGRLVMVEEPDTLSPYVLFFKGEEEHPQSELTWVEGRTAGSKAVRLDGVNEFLRLGYQQLKFSQMTFSGWFYWEGAAQGQPTRRNTANDFLPCPARTTRWPHRQPLDAGSG